MKTFLTMAVFLATSTLAPAALINIRFDGVANSNIVLPVNVNGQVRAEAAGLLRFTDTALNAQFLAYCLEPFVSVGAIGTSGVYDNSSTTWGGLTLAKQNAIRLLLGQVTNPFSASLSELDQAALQVGIWEIIGEPAGPFNAGAGAFFVVNNPNSQNVINQANVFLGAVNNNSGTAFTGVIALTNSSLQDLIVIGDPGAIIPEPTSLSLLGGALVAIGLLRLRR